MNGTRFQRHLPLNILWYASNFPTLHTVFAHVVGSGHERGHRPGAVVTRFEPRIRNGHLDHIEACGYSYSSPIVTYPISSFRSLVP